MYNEDHDLFQGCTPKGWWAFHEYPTHPCTGTTSDPAIGETCTDGSIYAGLSPDGNVPMYTTPADAPSTYSWGPIGIDTMLDCNDPSPGTSTTCQTGEANTAILVGLGGTYGAAEYCDGLSAHGHDDWYLPAQDELNALFLSKNIGDLAGTFNETATFPFGTYWSSSEASSDNARFQNLSDGFQSSPQKDNALAVRCVRKGA